MNSATTSAIGCPAIGCLASECTAIECTAIECPICLEETTNYMITQCNHTICSVCIEGLKNNENQHKFNGVLNKKYIKCPLCREFEKYSYDDLNNLCYVTWNECQVYKEMVEVEQAFRFRLKENNERLRENNKKLSEKIQLLEENNKQLLEKIQLQEEQVKKPEPKRMLCSGQNCDKMTQRKCIDCSKKCCRNCYVCMDCQTLKRSLST